MNECQCHMLYMYDLLICGKYDNIMQEINKYNANIIVGVKFLTWKSVLQWPVGCAKVRSECNSLKLYNYCYVIVMTDVLSIYVEIAHLEPKNYITWDIYSGDNLAEFRKIRHIFTRHIKSRHINYRQFFGTVLCFSLTSVLFFYNLQYFDVFRTKDTRFKPKF